jgi:hypothetical protein
MGGRDKVIILNIDGSLVREISTNGGVNYNLLYTSGRVTTALSVHGTTVIHLGSLVNDISSS